MGKKLVLKNGVLQAEDETVTVEAPPLPPPPTEEKPKQKLAKPKETKPDSPNLITFKSGLGWIVASILGGILLTVIVIGLL